MAPTPVALFVNCLAEASASRADPSTLVLDVLPQPSPQSRVDRANSRSYDWTLANKYYTADVEVVVVPAPLLPGEANPTLDERLSDRVEALALCFDAESSASFDLVKHWVPFVDRFSPLVRILVCEKCGDDGGVGSVSRADAVGWCIDNQFELIELDEEREEEEEEEEDDDDIGRPFSSGEFGVPRLVAALHAHTWSNLEMKENRSEATGERTPAEAAPEGDGDDVVENDDESRRRDVGEDDRLKEIFENLNLTGEAGDGDDEESFERLFNQMAQLKNQSQNLPFEERKVFAERVTMAFWRAIGGDEDELGGLDDDD